MAKKANDREYIFKIPNKVLEFPDILTTLVYFLYEPIKI